MRAEPIYPLLVVDPKGWLGFFADSQKQRFSWYSALNTKRWVGYDSVGELWRMSPDSFPWNDSWWRRVLANTIYNPRFYAELYWESTGNYSFADLQALICLLADKDDVLYSDGLKEYDLGHVLTQDRYQNFIDEFRARLGAHPSFFKLI